MEGATKDILNNRGIRNERRVRSKPSRRITTPFSSATASFMKVLDSKKIASADEVILKMTGWQLTLGFLQQTGFFNPILVQQKEGLDITIPPDTLSASDVEQYVGSQTKVDVIEVTRQRLIRMTIGKFVRNFLNPRGTKILNLISLEISNTPLGSVVEAPYVVRQLDWVNHVWPKDGVEDKTLTRPQVGKYCYLSMKNSVTDFHIDCGGTSVWYHLLWGEKTFFLINPTCANLFLYLRWFTSSTKSETFFGDQVDRCYIFTMKKGETLLIPTGWIYAVFTPVDSLMFGGNFLHSLNIQQQLQVHEMEMCMNLPKKFLYPSFKKLNWFAARSLLGELKQAKKSPAKVPLYILLGCKALLWILTQWKLDKEMKRGVQNQIPKGIRPKALLKQIYREVIFCEILTEDFIPPNLYANSFGTFIERIKLWATLRLDETEYTGPVLECNASKDVHRDGNDDDELTMKRQTETCNQLGPSLVSDINLLKRCDDVFISMRIKRILMKKLVNEVKKEGKRRINNDRERHEEPEKMNCTAERECKSLNPAELADNETRLQIIPDGDETEFSGQGFDVIDICNYKAVGVDNIPVELLKCLGKCRKKALYGLIHSIYEEGIWPEDFVRSVLVHNPKKGEAISCDEYRNMIDIPRS